MPQHIRAMLALLRTRWQAAQGDDTGATAIEWAIFAVLAVGIAGAVAAAIWLAVTSRIPGIQ
jgi:Flp pilus assembly pilin Flp